MKLKPGKYAYEIPPHTQVLSVAVDERETFGPSYMLYSISFHEITDMLEKDDLARGMPKYVALSGEVMVVFPRPDKPYNLVGHYTPPVQEF